MEQILVTGGSGFLGRHLVKRLLDKYKDIEVRIISRDENDIARMLAVCRDSRRLMPIVGDIRDVDSLGHALRGVDTVVHLAAMKHIDFCELHPTEAVTINVIGTMNLLKLFTGSKFVGMSTDKAVESSGCYGATKLLIEKLTLEQAKRHPDRKYMVVRSGNIFGSSGSVIENWKEQIKQNNEIMVTNPEMTRFFITVGSLADFIIEIMEQGGSGNIYIPPQKVIKLEDLARATIDLYGNKDTKLKIIGLREGEKMHEKLFLPWEKVVSYLKDDYSEHGEKLSQEEIKNWLTD